MGGSQKNPCAPPLCTWSVMSAWVLRDRSTLLSLRWPSTLPSLRWLAERVHPMLRSRQAPTALAAATLAYLPRLTRRWLNPELLAETVRPLNAVDA
jgi:hypothetical protein